MCLGGGRQLLGGAVSPEAFEDSAAASAAPPLAKQNGAVTTAGFFLAPPHGARKSSSRALPGPHACFMRVRVPGGTPPSARAALHAHTRTHTHTYTQGLQEEGPARQLCVQHRNLPGHQSQM